MLTHTNEKSALTGGRIGEIYHQNGVVLRPAKPWSVAVQRFLRFLCDEGADFVPVPLGINDKNEEMLSYLPGTVYNYPLPPVMRTDNLICSAARLLRTFHDRGAAYLSRLNGAEPWMLPTLSGPYEVMCHGDFAPYNITVQHGKATGIIDFDTLQPGPRLWDTAYAAYRFAPLSTTTANEANGITVHDAIHRAGLFLAAYGAPHDACNMFVPGLTARLRALIRFMQTQAQQGDQTFQRHIADGHLALYQNDIAWLEAHADEITYEVSAACCFSAHRVTVLD